MAKNNGNGKARQDDEVPDHVRYTPTQKRILKLLSDGLHHKRLELIGCLYDEKSGVNALGYQIYTLRRLLWPRGEDIACEISGFRILYRHVRLLHHSPKE